MNQIKKQKPFELYAEDKISSTWNRLQGYLTNRLYELRMQNDRPMDDKDTANLRGRIAEIKSLLSLGEDKPDIS